MNRVARMLQAITQAEQMLPSTPAEHMLHSVSHLFQVPRGELAELLLAKLTGCARARALLAEVARHDAQVEATPTQPGEVRPGRVRSGPRAQSAASRSKTSESLRRFHEEKRRQAEADQADAAQRARMRRAA